MTSSQSGTAEVQSAGTPSPAPAKSDHGLLHRLLLWTEIEAKIVGADISAEIAAIRAKL